jgi:1-acyl-sn-glycerol-3-phosphate acyltransferase
MRGCFGLELVNVANVPRDRTLIFAGNHASHYDGLFAMTSVWLIQRRDPAAVAWSGVRNLPVGRQAVATGALDLILADEGPMTAHKAAALLGGVIDRLEAGRSVVLHAEGHRREALGEFMQGAAVAALLTGVAIVPFTLRGVHGLWSSLAWPARPRGKVSVVFHPPLDPGEYSHLPLREGAPAMTAELRRRVASAIDYPDALAQVSDPRG